MNSNHRVLGVLAIACLSLISFSGCGSQPPATGDGQANQLPKMNFHKPASFAAAVMRIRAIHDALVSDDALPEAIAYKVREVSHSHGQEAAHVHYHLVDETGDHDHDDHHEHGDDDHDHDDHGHDDHDHGDDHDHDHDDAPQTIHTITVDIFTEFNDIAKWLPAIASDGDLSRDSWNVSKDVSGKITNHLEKVGQSDQSAAKRKSYQDQSSEVEKWIQEIEALVEPAPATTEEK